MNVTGNENKEVLISVIVPCYNYGHFLAETLQSVAAQNTSDWECIIVDNGSTDNTKEVAAGFVNSDKRFRYFYMAQSGVSAARNFGIRNASGSFILPLDADDKIEPSYLGLAAPVLARNAEIKVVYCDASLFGASSGKWVLPSFSFRELLIENLIFCSALFRKKDFEECGGYNEQMREGFEDWDFWISMLSRGGEVYKIPHALFWYRIRPGSRNNSLDHKKQLALRRQIYERHKDVYQEHFLLPDLIYDYYLERKQARAVTSSRSFRVGAFILSPLNLLRRLVSRRDV
jgi:glycosyltransferase involved in cell wall biosynthesis